MTETKRHRVPLRGPVGPGRSPSLPRAGPPLRPGVAGASGRHGHGRVHPGASRGNRLGYGASNSWGGVRGERHRGGGKERDRRPHHGRRPAPGTVSTTLSITKYTDKYKTWRGLEGEGGSQTGGERGSGEMLVARYLIFQSICISTRPPLIPTPTPLSIPAPPTPSRFSHTSTINFRPH
ncbi:hypothetical protein E2C01_071600 [Portunus trituberculatus]|uniref:Uncharacterized protein n=1 Tax=Portunus trituberculatus TaxID=210409 RepID=A0A5B7I4C3_PORTR|nr:hypothetical protein [Portunus trituberculatus]